MWGRRAVRSSNKVWNGCSNKKNADQECRGILGRREHYSATTRVIGIPVRDSDLEEDQQWFSYYDSKRLTIWVSNKIRDKERKVDWLTV